MASAAAGAAEKDNVRPSAAAFGAPSRASDVRLSFDGKSAAWFDLGSVPQRIIVFDLVNQKDRTSFLAPAGLELNRLEWSDENTLLFTASATRSNLTDSRIAYEYSWIFVADIASGKVRMLFDDQIDQAYVTRDTLIAAHTSKPATAIVSSPRFNHTAAHGQTGTRITVARKDSGWVSTLYEIDTHSGKARDLSEGTPFTIQWVIDADGNPAARSEWDPKTHDFTVLAKRGQSWTQIYHRNDGKRLDLHALTVDGKFIAALGLDQDGRSKVLALPLDGTALQVLFEEPGHEVVGASFDRFDNRLLAVRVDGLESEFRIIDPQYQQRAKVLTKIYPGRTVELVDQSSDRSLLLARVYSADKPSIYYVIDYSTHKADILAETYPTLAEIPLGTVSAMAFKSRDGSSIPAYLTSPPGYSPGAPIPLVVLVHGGPESRDHFEFNWLTQFIASRGYLVLQPQYRGSTGFGEEFRKAGMHEWGGVMQDDVTDGVKAMIDQHLADPHRICIVGAGYGGYAALAGAAFTPSLYACAVSINGLFDLPLFQVSVEKLWGENSNTLAYWHDHMGAPQDPKLAERSPGRHAASVSAHVLLLQTTEATSVPAEQSYAMAESLRLADKQVKLVKLPGDEDWLSSSATRMKILQEMDAFLQSNLPN
ncbi:MAG TPA: alpha/beta fold hydrolase [Steroidobacteraceae bacterium]